MYRKISWCVLKFILPLSSQSHLAYRCVREGIDVPPSSVLTCTPLGLEKSFSFPWVQEPWGERREKAAKLPRWGQPWQGWALFVLAAGLPGQCIRPSGHCSLDFRLDLREDSPRAERPIINKKSPWQTASSKEPPHSRVAGVWFSHFQSSLTQASSLLGTGDSQVTWGGREPLFKGCVFLEGSTSDD